MILPESGKSRAPKQFIKVVFPEPDGPTIAINSPFLTVRFTLLSAVTMELPTVYVLVRSFTSRTISGSILTALAVDLRSLFILTFFFLADILDTSFCFIIF